uniref:Uncharacterized protein n=1 Tax=Oryza rufipogon TaxID=4529 RepID=A0A0E0R9T0_ORYRU
MTMSPWPMSIFLK